MSDPTALSDEGRRQLASGLDAVGAAAQECAVAEAAAGEHYPAALWRTISALAATCTAVLRDEPLPELPEIPDPPLRLGFDP